MKIEITLSDGPQVEAMTAALIAREPIEVRFGDAPPLRYYVDRITRTFESGSSAENTIDMRQVFTA